MGDHGASAGVDTEQRIDFLDSQIGEDALLDDIEQVEEAQAEEDISVDEIGKAQHLEAQNERDSNGIPEKGKVRSPIEARDGGEIGVEPVEALEDGRYGKTQPHQRIFEKRLDQRGPGGGILDHGKGHLDHGKDEALVLDPLLAQDHHNGDHGQIEG